jgi:4-amino-4-deoxy-L-arabinose transferase-like glycosyltransferase
MNNDVISRSLYDIKKLANWLHLKTYEWCPDFLSYYSYIILTTLFLCLIGAALLSRQSIKKLIAGTSPGSILWLLGIIATGAVIRFGVLRHHPQVFYDEAYMIETAQSYYHFALNMHYNDGPMPSLLFICPSGWPYLVSLAFRLTGMERIDTAFALSAFLTSVAPVFVFYLVSLLFQNQRAGLWSAAAFAVHPVICRFSTSSAMEPSSITFFALSIFLVVWYLRERDTILLYLAFFSLGYMSNIRQEAFMTLLPLLLLFFVLFHPDIRGELKRPHIYINLALLFVFILPAALSSLYGVSTSYYYFFEPPNLMRKHILHNLQFNVTYWISNRIHPLSITLAALVGWWMLLKKDRALALFFGGMFLFLQFFYSINPSCDFSSIYTLDSWRTAANQILILIILSGLALEMGLEYFRQHYPRLAPLVTALLIFTVLIVPFRYYSFMSEKTIWAGEYLYVKKFTSGLDPSSRIIVERAPHLITNAYFSMFRYVSAVPASRHTHMKPENPYSARKLLKDFHRWKYQEMRPVYVHFSGVNDEIMKEKLDWYDKTFVLVPVSGYGLAQFKTGFINYELTGFKDPPPPGVE